MYTASQEKGQRFEFISPATAVPRNRQGEPDEQASEGHRNNPVSRRSREPSRLAQETLGALGYHVILASNGIEAVQLFKDNSDRIDLVVMDVVMPGMSGPMRT